MEQGIQGGGGEKIRTRLLAGVGDRAQAQATQGVTVRATTNYKTACREGWAPAPTNDVQKAIWDKVHAMPTEPIKIKPEEKKTEK